jgi:hypothetical protein
MSGKFGDSIPYVRGVIAAAEYDGRDARATVSSNRGSVCLAGN